MTSSHAIGFLAVSQSLATDAAALSTCYDMAIGAVGWEARTNHALSLYAGKVDRVTYLHFSSSEDIFIKKKASMLEEAKKLASDNLQIKDLAPSVDFSRNLSSIEDMITGVVQIAKRPISIVLDITCIPKRYFLFLVAMGFRKGLFSRVDVLYSEGKYHPPTPNQTDSPNLGFLSGGEWSSVQIPYLEGANYAPNERDLFVSMGAEITQAVPIVERFEPEKLILYEVADSEARFPPNYLDPEKTALSMLKAFPAAESVTFKLDDVVGIARSVLKSRGHNTTCLALGAKPHALAFGIAALADDRIQVVCRNPQGYIMNDVSPAGNVFRFRIEDRFEPKSAWG